VAGLRVCLTSWLLGWQDRGLVTARMLCLMLVRLTGWMVLLAGAAAAKDAGLLVVRQEVAVLRRQNPRPGPGRADRRVTAALTRLLPRLPRMSRLVRAGTLLRWQRRLARRRWACPRRGGRPSAGARVAVLTGQVARENPGRGDPRIAGERPGPGIRGSASGAAGAETATFALLRIPLTWAGISRRWAVWCVAQGGSCALAEPGWRVVLAVAKVKNAWRAASPAPS
jgi:hypothetical protein